MILAATKSNNRQRAFEVLDMTAEETSAKSASSNARVRHNIHVLPSRMMAKAMWHMDVPSLLLRRRYCVECRITFDAAAPRDSKGRPEAVSLWV